MIKAGKKLDILVFAMVVVLVLMYTVGIFSVNFGGRAFNDFDMYSDSVLAKYMWSEKTLFPDGWHFGNQIYVVATPVLAGFVYPLMGDTYAALAMASCLMTLLVMGSFLWCVRPFLSGRSAWVGLLVLIGGMKIGVTAHKGLEGLQLFYTMASYYACYIIGIFLTLGVYNRYLQGISVNKGMLTAVILLNFALGMQSLREMLVLNLPLCSLVLCQILLMGKRESDSCRKKSCRFALGALIFNGLGLLTSKLLAANGVFVQSDILQDTQPGIWENVMVSVSSLAEYIGLIPPYDVFSTFRFAVAVLSVGIVAAALVLALKDCIEKKPSVIALNILFFAISLLAVACAGVLVIKVRSIYFFCWYLMVTFCVVYLLDRNGCRVPGKVLKRLLIVAIIGISIINYNYLFRYSYVQLNSASAFYGQIAHQLQKDGIRYLYTDAFSEQSMIATMSRDEITYAIQNFSGDPEDLWENVAYLYHEDWYAPENYDDAYVLLTDRTLNRLEGFSTEYKEVFLENLQLKYEFAGNGTIVYLYQGTEKMYHDMGY